MKVHCARLARTIEPEYPSEVATLVSWCGRAKDKERPLGSVIVASLWDWLPSTAMCGRCARSIGGGLVRPVHVAAVEAGLIELAREIARWP